MVIDSGLIHLLVAFVVFLFYAGESAFGMYIAYRKAKLGAKLAQLRTRALQAQKKA